MVWSTALGRSRTGRRTGDRISTLSSLQSVGDSCAASAASTSDEIGVVCVSSFQSSFSRRFKKLFVCVCVCVCVCVHRFNILVRNPVEHHTSSSSPPISNKEVKANPMHLLSRYYEVISLSMVKNHSVNVNAVGDVFCEIEKRENWIYSGFCWGS